MALQHKKIKCGNVKQIKFLPYLSIAWFISDSIRKKRKEGTFEKRRVKRFDERSCNSFRKKNKKKERLKRKGLRDSMGVPVTGGKLSLELPRDLDESRI